MNRKRSGSATPGDAVAYPPPAAQLDVLLETIRDLTSTLAVSEVLGRLLDRALEHLASEIGSILTLDAHGALKIAVARGLPEEIVRTTRSQVGDGISGHVAAAGESLLIGDIESDPRFARSNHERYYTNSLLSVPIVFRGTTRGVINVNNKSSREGYTESDRRLLEALAGHAAVALLNAQRYEALLERAQHDALTGLANHGHFRSALESELSRASRYEREVSVVMIDVDFFKSFNDRYGHLAGDQALVKVARGIQQCCRASDMAGRYGGEEFGVILPETPIEGGQAFGEKIRASIEALAFGPSDEARLSISAGVATFPRDGETPRDVLEAADKQLYRAKSLGRNRVCATCDRR